MVEDAPEVLCRGCLSHLPASDPRNGIAGARHRAEVREADAERAAADDEPLGAAADPAGESSALRRLRDDAECYLILALAVGVLVGVAGLVARIVLRVIG
jgi:hypothetical protein